MFADSKKYHRKADGTFYFNGDEKSWVGILMKNMSVHDHIVCTERGLVAAIIPKSISLDVGYSADNLICFDKWAPDYAELHDSILKEKTALRKTREYKPKKRKSKHFRQDKTQDIWLYCEEEDSAYFVLERLYMNFNSDCCPYCSY